LWHICWNLFGWIMQMLPDDIQVVLMIVVKCCMEWDYMTAMDQYIKLAIGNAPWPIGVTMVGIHKHSAHEKIYTYSVAHIMNDETTRKYLQSIKRLMTVCQQWYPSMPSSLLSLVALLIWVTFIPYCLRNLSRLVAMLLKSGCFSWLLRRTMKILSLYF